MWYTMNQKDEYFLLVWGGGGRKENVVITSRKAFKKCLEILRILLICHGIYIFLSEIFIIYFHLAYNSGLLEVFYFSKISTYAIYQF